MHKLRNKSGFTVLELMIATTVFSVILVVCTTAIIGMTRLYYKSLSNGRVQETTRSIIDEISQSIQFSGGAIVGVENPPVPLKSVTNTTITPNETRKYFCVDKKSYAFVLGKKVSSSSGPTQTVNALVYNPLDLCGDATAELALKSSPQLELPAGGRQLVPENMRLAKLNVKALSNNLYEVTVRVIYGDDDLICSPSVAGSCTTSATMAADKLTSSTDLTCKSQRAGSQFCAVSELTTTVQKRVQ